MSNMELKSCSVSNNLFCHFPWNLAEHNKSNLIFFSFLIDHIFSCYFPSLQFRSAKRFPGMGVLLAFSASLDFQCRLSAESNRSSSLPHRPTVRHLFISQKWFTPVTYKVLKLSRFSKINDSRILHSFWFRIINQCCFEELASEGWLMAWVWVWWHMNY